MKRIALELKRIAPEFFRSIVFRLQHCSNAIRSCPLGYKKLSGINERYSFEDPNSIFLLKCKHLKWLKPIASIPYPSKMLMELGTAFSCLSFSCL